MTNVSCYRCKFFIRFTSIELDFYNSLTHGNTKPGAIGLCVSSLYESDTYFKNIIYAEVNHCDFSIPGFYREDLALTCPKCKGGNLGITRPKDKMGVTFAIINCSYYPKCDFHQYQVQSNQPCKFCNSPLILSVLNGFTVKCPQCHRSAQVPFLFHTYPALFRNSKCIHGHLVDTCVVCCEVQNNSKIDVFNFELNALIRAKPIKTLSNSSWNNSNFPANSKQPKKYFCSYLSDETIEKAEELAEYRKEIFFFLKMEENDIETGWYYGEEKPHKRIKGCGVSKNRPKSDSSNN